MKTLSGSTRVQLYLVSGQMFTSVVKNHTSRPWTKTRFITLPTLRDLGT